MDAWEDMHGEAYRKTVGEEDRNRFRELAAKAIDSSKNMIFQFNPKMSAVSTEFAAGDPDFWTPKPAAPTKKP